MGPRARGSNPVECITRRAPGSALTFAQDFSNPMGCDDVCDAQLCFSREGGIVAVGGLYAPNYLPYAAR